MSHLHFPGMNDIRDRIFTAPCVLLGLDFDGTLTPIVDDPAHARLAPAVRDTLCELANRDDVDVAIVSGRALKDLKERTDIPTVICAGNHGMEIDGPSLHYVEPIAHASTPMLHAIALDLIERLRHIADVVVEDKGPTISIHYRRANPVDVEQVWGTVLAAVEPVRNRFRVTHGAKVYEVRPLVRWDKGAAVRWIQDQLDKGNSLVIYIGDDATDEDAFSTLGANAVTIKVGNTATATSACYLLPSPAEVHQFLRWVNQLLTEKRGDQ
jgi:trehalose-phosphatase